MCHDELNEQENAVRDWSALCTLEPHNGDLPFGCIFSSIRALHRHFLKPEKNQRPLKTSQKL